MDNNFKEYGIDANVLRAMTESGLVNPTPIQQQVIPTAMTQQDVVAQAPTGTGKTLAFLLPALSHIDRENKDVQVLIVCPTRELVIQTGDVLKQITKYYESLKGIGIYGGQNIQRQLETLRKKPQIVIATPGRLFDHMERHTIKLNAVKYVVLDEGDEMFDMGFRGDIEQIFKKCPKDCQKLVFSATIPREIQKLINESLTNPQYFKVENDKENMPKIAQRYTILKDSQRVPAIIQIIAENNYKLCLIFCNTKMRADRISEALVSKGKNAMVIHGDLRQSARTKIMQQFKAKTLEILVATDVAARGIDVDGIEAIFNVDPPLDCDSYIHRIGRTARAKKDGVAYTFVTAEQVGSINNFQKATGNALEFFEMEISGDSYTLPHDGSDRMRPARNSNSTRFFLNVGTRDLLDRDSMLKIIAAKTSIQPFQVVDVKLRDTYGFVEVIKGQEAELLKLVGTTFGNRTLTIEKADAKTRDPKAPSGNFKPRGASGGFDRGDRPSRSSSFGHRDGDFRNGYSDRKSSYSRQEYTKTEGTAEDSADNMDKNLNDKDTTPRDTNNSARPAKSYGDRPARTYGDRPARSYGDKPTGDRPARTYGDRPTGDRPARTYGDRPARSYGDKPAGDRPARTYGDRPTGDRPARTYGDRPTGDRPARTYGDRPARSYGDKPTGDRPARTYGDRPTRSYGDKPAGDRPARTYGDRPTGDRPARTYGDRPTGDRPARTYGDRPARSYGDKPTGDRPARTYGDRPTGDIPARTYGDRPTGDRPARTYGDRPARSYGDKPTGDRTARTYGDIPARSYGDKPTGDRPARTYGDRPARSYGDKPTGDRPARTYGDRPARSYGDKPTGDRPARTYGDRPARSYGDKPTGDRPARTYGDRPARSYGDKPAGDRPARSYGDRPTTGTRSHTDRPRPSSGGSTYKRSTPRVNADSVPKRKD